MFTSRVNEEKEAIKMASGKKSYLLQLVKWFAIAALFDVVITGLVSVYALFKDNPHSNIKLMLIILLFNKTIPTIIISLISLCSGTHSDRVDASAGWTIMMLLNFLWDIFFIAIGAKYLKYDGSKESDDSVVSIFFLILYKILYAFFVIAAAIYSFMFINTHPTELYKARNKRNYNALPENQVRPDL